MFEVGDKVRCINSKYNNKLTLDQEYTVLEYDVLQGTESLVEVIKVLEGPDPLNWGYTWRFVKVPDRQKEDDIYI